MLQYILPLLTLLSVLGAGLMAGLFFVFSIAVMKALGGLPPEKGMAAMQSINRVIVNPVFLAVFLGTGATCVAGAILGVVHQAGPASRSLIMGGALYVIGGIVVTMAFNVPRNNALDAADPASPAGAALWRDYLSSWTAWNHVRTVACLASTAFLAIACRELQPAAQ